MFYLAAIFRFIIQQGTLRVIDADGKEHTFGKTVTPRAAVRLKSKTLYLKILLTPQLALGEGYMNGTLTIEEGTLYDVVHVLVLNQVRLRRFPMAMLLEKMLSFIALLVHPNSVGKVDKKIEHHYDISNEIYQLFLDNDLQYSCALFRDENDSIERAQEEKKKHIIAKLMLKKGLRVLDVGCGWGGLAIEMAKQYDVHVTGVTLSLEQYKLACARVEEAGLTSKVAIRLMDYRNLKGKFDRIVSIGMFEHVGREHYPEFFHKVNDLLTDDGLMLLHSIGSIKPSPTSNPWIRKYIFPGGYIPSLSECIPHVEQADFWITDIEILRQHYAYTLRAWRERFQANKQAAIRLKDDVFYRMWVLYLTACEVGFMYGDLMVFQMQLTKDIQIAPFTRNYMYEPPELPLGNPVPSSLLWNNTNNSLDQSR